MKVRFNHVIDYSMDACLPVAEDFVQGTIFFTIRANSLEPEENITITIIDDEKFEPVEEGFRLVLLVNINLTPRSQVSFGASGQLALFRIDDYTDSELYMH